MVDTLFAGLLMLSQSLPHHQGLVALATWIARTLVDVHVMMHPMAHDEDLMTDRASSLIPGY